MTKFVQIVLLIMAVLWFKANGIPLFQGISFQRGFEINFKPLPRNPITFIKEKWSPFGVFGRKHSVQKRNSGSGVVPLSQASPIVPLVSAVPQARPAAPVFEHVEEIERTPPFIPFSQQTPGSVTPVPPLISPIQPQLISPVPPVISPIEPQPISPALPIVSLPPPVMPTNVPHSTLNFVPPPSIPPQVVSISPNQPITNDVPLEPPLVRMDGSLPPISSNMVIPPPGSGRYTDVTRTVPVREYVNSIQPVPPPPVVEEKTTPPLETNSIKPEPPRNDIVISDNSLIRGSKLALYFGSIFLQLMSQFMNNARATFDQMTNPPPVFRN